MENYLVSLINNITKSS